MQQPRPRAGIPLVVLASALVLLVAACTAETPEPEPTPTDPPAAPATPEPTPEVTPEPTPEPPAEFPLAVVTGYTNLKAETSIDELEELSVKLPCDVETPGLAVTGDGECLPADEIASWIVANPDGIALLPAGLVEPKTKVLTVGGADLFGNPEARGTEYPIIGQALGLPDEWTAYEVEEIRTLISLGDSCPDRGVAYQAITLGRGWDWVFGGGRAEYVRIYPHPAPPGQVGHGFNVVEAVPAGDEGAVARLVSGADITVDDFECPVVDNWRVAMGGSVVFTIDPRVLGHLRDDFGVDVVTLAANHLFDAGTSGFIETLEKFDAAGIARTGAGRDLDEALEPAVLDVDGLRFGFVGHNEIPGSLEAAPGQPGVAWLREEYIYEAVGRAREQADLVFCLPQWWGGAEYHAEWRPTIRQQQEWYFDAGCDHILGHGTHWSGPIDFTVLDDGRVGFTIVSHGNFLFGQDWSQQTQEGVVVELAFRGTELVQARMHPYIMLLQAQPNLTDPENGGRHVLTRILDASEVDY
jgi:poly-gamma-glutamate capsule biosynthesis protein CapA/YwtB (metallophosphatase superfamily)